MPSLPNASPEAIPLDWRISTDAASAYAIHLAAAQGAPAGMIRADSLSHFERHTGRDGVTLGCTLDGGAMVAYGVLGLDSPMAQQLAALMQAAPSNFAVLDGAAALPQWRGHGLHQASIDRRIAYAATCGKRIVGATASPHNLRALGSLLRAGMAVTGAARLYGGLDRLLLQKELHMAPVAREVRRLVACADSAGHLIAFGAGLRGFALQRDAAGTWHICYG